MTVRGADVDDIAAIMRLGEAMVAELTPHLKFDPKRAWMFLYEAIVERNAAVFVVEDGEPIGFLTARVIDYAACAGFYIQQDLVYVRPDKRGTRAAASLFAHFTKWARELQPEEVFAGIGWGRRSDAAARWMKRFGYEPTGQRWLRLRVGGERCS